MLKKPGEFKMQNNFTSGLKKLTSYREFILIIVLVICSIGVSIFTPYFFTRINILSMLMGLTVEGLIAIGMVMVLVSGGMDLSVGATMAFTGVAAGLLLKNGVPVVPAVILALLVALAIGMVNGLLISKVKLNPFIITLGMMSAVKGLMLVLAKGRAILDMPPAFKIIGQGSLGKIQYPIIIMIILVIIGDLLLRNSRYMRQSYYVGSNENSAKLNGINVSKVKIVNYCICSFFAGIAGIMIAARFGSASVTLGDNTALNVITACIIGGASLNGGGGTVLGAFLGAVFMQMLSTSLNLLNVNIYWQNFIVGAILIFAIFIGSVNENKKISKKPI
jgi:ribose transport system permease protein